MLRQVMMLRINDRWRRLLCLLPDGDGRNEAVSLPRTRIDELPALLPVAEDPPKGDHLDFEISFDDVGVGPDTSKQLVLPDPLAGPFDKGEKDIKGATPEAYGFARLQQKTLAGQDLKTVERERGSNRREMRLWHCSLALAFCQTTNSL